MLLYLYILYIALKTVSHLFFCNPCFRNLSVGDMLNPRLSLSFFTNHLLCPEAPLIIRGKGSYSAVGNFFSRKKWVHPRRSRKTRGPILSLRGTIGPAASEGIISASDRTHIYSTFCMVLIIFFCTMSHTFSITVALHSNCLKRAFLINNCRRAGFRLSLWEIRTTPACQVLSSYTNAQDRLAEIDEKIRKMKCST